MSKQAASLPAAGTQARINILYMLDHVGIGGTAVHLLQVLRHLDLERFNPVVCCLDWKESSAYDPPGYDIMMRKFRQAGAAVETLQMASVYRWRYLREYRSLAGIMRRHNIAVIHANLFDSTVAGILTAAWLGIPVRIASRRESAVWMKPRHHWAMRLTNRLCHAVIVNSSEIAHQCRAWQGLAAEKIRLIYNGIDHHDLQQRLSLHTPRPLSRTGHPVIGMVGNLVPLKGHSKLLQAMVTVLREFPDCKLVLVGDGPLRHDLESQAASLGIAANIIFAGRCPCETWLHSFSLAVLSSLSEGGSNAVLEYMSAGLPMVVTAVGAHPEILCHREHACLVPPADSQALANEIIWILKHRDLATAMGEAARRELLEKYTSGIMAQKMMNLYLELAERNMVKTA